MIIDGKKMAEKIKGDLRKRIVSMKRRPRLSIILADDGSFSSFVMMKKKFGESIGAEVRLHKIPADVSANKFRAEIGKICRARRNEGIIVQLPLPKHMNTQYVLNGILPKKDVDILSSRAFGNFATGHSAFLPPVVGAIAEIFTENKIEVAGKNVVVVGAGILVGRPVAIWLMNQGATVSVVNEFTKNISEFTKIADIIVSGAGVRGLITNEMVKEGVIVIDAGITMEGRKIFGDCDKSVSEKASLFTPVPGGIGPITVAMVFKNLLDMTNFQG